MTNVIPTNHWDISLTPCAEDGFYDEDARGTRDGPTAKSKVLKKIPKEVRLPITLVQTPGSLIILRVLFRS